MTTEAVTPPHVARMEGELAELSDRVEKLTVFTSTNPIFKTLAETDQNLMTRQLAAMRQYEDILSLRLQRAA